MMPKPTGFCVPLHAFCLEEAVVSTPQALLLALKCEMFPLDHVEMYSVLQRLCLEGFSGREVLEF